MIHNENVRTDIFNWLERHYAELEWMPAFERYTAVFINVPINVYDNIGVYIDGVKVSTSPAETVRLYNAIAEHCVAKRVAAENAKLRDILDKFISNETTYHGTATK